MKRMGMLLMVMLVGAALVFAGCGGDDTQQNQGQPQQQQQNQQDGAVQKDEDGANPAGAEVQTGKNETVTLNGAFQGLADGHSAEIAVDGEPMVFQFHDEDIAEQLEIMETDTAIQFDVETDDETGVKTIVKLYERAE
ncbi:MAG: hypothetical protein J6J05_01680 [Peptococcaceae bacterium]|nr:hypothetical protein [Peptococcaceae bacterium]